MSRRIGAIVGVFALLATSLSVMALAAGPASGSELPQSELPLPEVRFEFAGRYATGNGDGSAEIVSYADGLAYLTNGEVVDVVDLADPADPTLVSQLDPPGSGEPTSVAAGEDFIVVAVPSTTKTDPGKVSVFDTDGDFIVDIGVGSLPDMITFTPDEKYVLVANEGEPNSYGQPDSVDPEGSVSIIKTKDLEEAAADADKGKSPKRPKVVTARFSDFNVGAKKHKDLPPGVRIFGPGATVAQDLEPEYIAVDAKSKLAYVTLQENNAVAVVKISSGEVEKIVDLGTLDHSVPGQGIDASDRDGRVNIQNWPVEGFRMPDAIATFESDEETYYVTANEGDAREYVGINPAGEEGDRAGDLADLTLFPEADDNAQLGRLNITELGGVPTNGAGEVTELRSFGTRSFSIFDADGNVVFDSGDDFERITAASFPANFNADNDEDDFEGRSDNKGPEPEAVTVGEIDGRTLAFIGLERIGGTMVYDVTDPTTPVFQQYLTTRVFDGGDPGPDLAPEGITLVAADESPTGVPLLLVAHEVSGTLQIWQQQDLDTTETITLLHNNDGESTILPLDGGGEQVAGVAAYKSVVDREITDARNSGNAVFNVYAGDAFLASATLSCSLPPNPADTPVFDAVAQAQMTYDTHVFGNHEFDFTPDYLERFIRAFDRQGTPDQPFLSSNLDFSGEPGFADLIDGDGTLVRQAADGRVVAKAAILTDEVTGSRVGIIGATTPSLRSVSSPRSVAISSTDIASTATVVQGEIDAFGAAGINKVVVVSHLQSIANDQELVSLLTDVDIAVAGGGDELLAAPTDPLLPGDAPGDIAGAYPLIQVDAVGVEVPIVTTSGNYKYVGRLDVTFDAAGNLVGVDDAASYPRRVVVGPAAGIIDAVEPNAGVQATVVDPVIGCLDALAEPAATTESVINVSRSGAGSLGFANGVRTGETNGGNLVADGYLAAYDTFAPSLGLAPRGPANRVIAVQNGGGIRQNGGDVLPVGTTFDGASYTGVPGDISRLDTFNVLAFDNSTTVLTDITPAELKQIMEHSAVGLGSANGGFLQIGGFSVVYTASGTAQVTSPAPTGENAGDITSPGTRVVSITLDDGTAIVAGGAVVSGAPSVSIVTNSFSAQGGDNYAVFEDTPDSNRFGLPVSYEQTLFDYLTSFPVGASGLPTVPATDLRYADPDGIGRIAINP